MRILVVDDDHAVRRSIDRALRLEGYDVVAVPSGGEALEALALGPLDAVILDLGLPDLDGLSVCRSIRAAGDDTPVLMLTARDAIDDRVQGLDAGADDYLVKPFALAELLARVNALARRPPTQEVRTELSVADLRLDLLKRTVTRGGQRIELQPREFQLLEYLLRHAGRVVTRTMLLESVWDFHFDPKTNIVETHMSRLRGKVDRGHGCELIHTVRGAGYILREPD